MTSQIRYLDSGGLCILNKNKNKTRERKGEKERKEKEKKCFNGWEGGDA